MPTEHISHQIEAYLAGQLPVDARRAFENHVSTCSDCARELAEARYLITQLHRTLVDKLGKPVPPPYLRAQIRQKLYQTAPPQRWHFPWGFSGRLVNAIGTLAVILLLAVGVLVTIQGRLFFPVLPATVNTAGGGPQNTPVFVATSTPENTPRSTAGPLYTASAGDSLPLEARPTTQPTVRPTRPPATSAPAVDPLQPAALPVPHGTIAFAAFNPAEHRQVYELHLMNADGSNHQLFPLDGVSEPALWSGNDGVWLAYRAWSRPTSPRSLLTSDLTGTMPQMIGGFWEDTQPDWSPVEKRLVFASQRESDRRWRLYTSWGDGSAERDLHREGKSPSFAPDGQRLVFEGCDSTGEICGLWQTTLDNSEQTASLILADRTAQSPDWSPVGEQIVYMANHDNNWDLYLTDSNGEEPHRLTTSPAIDGLPVWSPDGAWLALVSNRDNHWGLWVMHVDSGHLREIYNFGELMVSAPAGEPYGNRQWWDEQLSWGP